MQEDIVLTSVTSGGASAGGFWTNGIRVGSDAIRQCADGVRVRTDDLLLRLFNYAQLQKYVLKIV